jgi:hypothetical protein
MFKETWVSDMKESLDIQTCSRANDLVAYLYGEATERARQDFQGHLSVCPLCRSDLDDFGSVRESIGLWRTQALDSVESYAPDMKLASAYQSQSDVSSRSIFGAIRDFFTLSPMWLTWTRGATALATLLIAALAVFALMSFFGQTESPVAERKNQPAPVKQELPNATSVPDEKVVAVQDEKRSTPETPVVRKPTAKKNVKNSPVNGNQLAANKQNRQQKATTLSAEERSQLSDLLIAERENEDSVPRLYDLLTESN